MPSSRLVPGRYPPAGTSAIADAIRARRGARGLTPLDGTLLHVPPVAEGWNTLLGAVRTKGNIPADLREIMILRVAARNHAKFEWIHHEHVARSAGVTTAQLRLVRDTSCVPSEGVLNALQTSALAFADQSTKDVQVSIEVMRSLKSALGSLPHDVDDLLVEAAAIVASYNMVSRFLVSLDVAGMSDELVPWPADRTEYDIPLPNSDTTIHAVTLVPKDISAPWLVFANSLLTNVSMWDYLLTHVLKSGSYNVLVHDQRGHGGSPPSGPVTIQDLAKDIAFILAHLNITNVQCIIGVSQGGAAALSFASQFPDKTKCIIACDTTARTAPGNKEAWEERIALASSQGMAALADVTVKRWFPAGSTCSPEGGDRRPRTEAVVDMITETSLEGFRYGAGALSDYDLIQSGLYSSAVPTLLVAGALDGGGRIAEGLRTLCESWNKNGGKAHVAVIDCAGHLPMIDETSSVWEIFENFLNDHSL